MSKTYSYYCICKNCGNQFYKSQTFGVIRPEKVQCPTCGCKAETTPIRDASKIFGHTVPNSMTPYTITTASEKAIEEMNESTNYQDLKKWGK